MASFSIEFDILYLNDKKVALILPEARSGILRTLLEETLNGNADPDRRPTFKQIKDLSDKIEELNTMIEELVEAMLPTEPP